MKKLHMGMTLEDFANFVRELELHLNNGWNTNVPIITGDGRNLRPTKRAPK